MQKTTTPIKPEVVTNPHSQQELDLSQLIRAALENSAEVAEAVKTLEESKAKKNRLIEELEKFRENKTTLEAEIEELKINFGSLDSLADLKKLEECKIKLEVVNEAIPLLIKQVDPNVVSNLSIQIQRNKEDLQRVIERELRKIKTQLQDDINAKTDDLFQTFDMYSKAIARAQTEQQVIPSNLHGCIRLIYIRPEVTGKVSELMNPSERLRPGFLVAKSQDNGEGVHGGTPGDIKVKLVRTVENRWLAPSDLENILKR